MANVIANINVNVNTAKAAANIAALQTQINNFAKQPLFSPQHIAQQKAWNNALAQSATATGQFRASIKPMASSVEQFNRNLDRGAFSMGQYARYTAGASKSLGRFFQAEKQIIDQSAKSRVAQMATQYTSLGGAVGSANKALALTPTHLNSIAARQQMVIERQRIMNTLLRQGNTRLLNWGKNTQWAGRQLMVGFTVPLTIFAGLAAKVFTDLEKQAVAFKKVYGDIFTTDQEVEQNLAAVRELSKEFTKYGIAVKDTMELATLAAQSGQRGAELMAATTEATRLSVLGQMEQQDAMKTTISLQTAFRLSNEELAEAVNFLNSVENQSVLSLQDVSKAIPIVAPVISSLGGNVQDLAALLVAMKEGGVTAGEGANALKTSLSRLISPTKAARDMARGFGIDLEELVTRNSGQVLPMITELASRMQNLSNIAQQQLLSEVFGKRQYARIGALFQNITKEGSQAQRVIGLNSLSMKELADTAEKELSAVEEATSTKLQKTFEALKVEIAPIGEQFLKVVTPLAKAAVKFFEFFNSLDDGIKNFTLLGLAITAIGGPIVMMVGLFANGLAQTLKFIHGLVALRARLIGNGAAFKEMTTAEREAYAATNSLGGATDSLRTKMLLNTTATNTLARSYGNLAAQAAAAAASMGRVPMGMPVAGRAAGAARAARAPQTQNFNVGGDVQAQKAFSTKPIFTSPTANTVPGAGNTDTVPAMLTPGEFVVNKQSTKQFLPLLKAINENGVKKYNAGGFFGSRPMPRMSQSEDMLQELMLGGKVMGYGGGGKIPRYMAGTDDTVPQSNRPKEEFLHQGPRRLATPAEVAAIAQYGKEPEPGGRYSAVSAAREGTKPMYMYSNLGVLGPGAYQSGATGSQMAALYDPSSKNFDRTMLPFYRAHAQAVTGSEQVSEKDIRRMMNDKDVKASVRETGRALSAAYASYGTRVLTDVQQYSAVSPVLQQRAATDPKLQAAMPFLRAESTVGYWNEKTQRWERDKVNKDVQRALGRGPNSPAGPVVTSYKSFAQKERIDRVMGVPAAVAPTGTPQSAAATPPTSTQPMPAAPSSRPKGQRPPPGSLKRDAAKISRQMVRSGYTYQQVAARMEALGFTPQQSQRIATTQFERSTPRTLSEVKEGAKARKTAQSARDEIARRQPAVEKPRTAREVIAESKAKRLKFSPFPTSVSEADAKKTQAALAEQKNKELAQQRKALSGVRDARRLLTFPTMPTGPLSSLAGPSSQTGLVLASDPRYGRSPSAPGSQMYGIAQGSLDQRPSSVRFGLAPEGAGRLRRGFARLTRPIRGGGNAGLGLMQRLAYGQGGGLARENLGLANASTPGRSAVLSPGTILREATKQIGHNMMMLSSDMGRAMKEGDFKSAGKMFSNAAKSAAKASVANTKFAANVQNAATRVSNFGRFIKELVTPGYARAFGPDKAAGGAGAAGGGGFFSNMFGGRGGGGGGAGGQMYGPALPPPPGFFKSGWVRDPETGQFVKQQSKLARGVTRGAGPGGMMMMMGSMLPMMMQDEEGKFAGMPAQTAMMGMMGGGMLLSMAPAFGAAAPAILGLAAAAAAAGIAIYKWRDNVDTAARKAAELGSNLGGTANAVNKMAQLMNLETPAQRQADIRMGLSEEEKVEDFGEFGQFLGNEQGQKFLDELKAMTSDQRFQALGDYLRSAIATGMMEKEQAQDFGRVVASSIGDGLLGVRVFKELATQQAGMEGMLDIAQRRLSEVEASSQIAEVESGERVGYGEASFAIGSSLQVMQDFSNVAALAREEFDKGTISFQEMKDAVDKATEVQRRYSDVIFNSLNNASDGGAIRQALKQELIRTGVVTEEQYTQAEEAFGGKEVFDAVSSEVDRQAQQAAESAGLEWLRWWSNLGRERSDAESEVVRKEFDQTKKGMENLYAELLATGRDPIAAQEMALAMGTDPKIKETYDQLFAQEDVSRVDAIEGAFLLRQREQGVVGTAEEAREKALAGGATEEEARREYNRIVRQEQIAAQTQRRYMTEAGGTAADFQVFEELLPDDQKMDILKQTADMTDEQFNKFVADYIELNGIVEDTDLTALIAQSDAYRNALAAGEGDAFVESVGAAQEMFGEDFGSVFNFVIESNVDDPGEYLDYITETANRFKTEIPSDVTAQLGINLTGPMAGQDMAKWGPIIDQMVEFMPAIREMEEGSLERNIAIGLMTTYDKDGNPQSVDPDEWIGQVRAAQKEIDKLGSDKKSVQKEAILSLLQRVENDAGETLTPEEALTARQELEEEFGEGKLLKLPADSLEKIIELKASIKGLKNFIKALEIERDAAYATMTPEGTRRATELQQSINQLNEDATKLESDMRAEYNLGRTQGTGGSTGSTGSRGSSGSKQASPVENLRKTVEDQLKLWGGLNVDIENLNKLKQNSIYKTMEGNSIFNKLKKVKGIGPSMLENILGMGPEGAQEFINKYIKNGKLTKQGQAFLGAQALGDTRQIIGESVISRRQSRQQVTAANTLRGQGRSQELIQQIAGDPKRAEIYNKLVEDSKNGVAGARKELNKFIKSQERQVELAEKAAEALQTPFELASQEQQKYFDKQSAFFDKAFADIEILAYQEFKVRTGMSVEGMEIEIRKNEDLIDKHRERIQTIQDEIRTIETRNSTSSNYSEWGLEQLQNEIDANKENIALLERQNELAQRRIDVLSRQDELRMRDSEKIERDLEQLSRAEEQIQQSYQKRLDALDKVARVNDHLINQQQQQLNLSQAISEGDIYRATQAAQQMRATSAEFAVENLRGGLERGMESQIANLRTEGGLTREQAEERIRQIQEQSYQTSLQIRVIEDEIYERQVKQILPLKDKEYALNQALQSVTAEIEAKQLQIRDIERSKIEPIERQNALYTEQKNDLLDDIAIEQSKIKNEAGLTRAEMERQNSWVMATLSNNELMTEETERAERKAADLAAQWKNVAAQVNNAKKALADQYRDIDLEPLGPDYTEENRNADRKAAWEAYNSRIAEILATIPGFTPADLGFENNFAGGMINPRRYTSNEPPPTQLSIGGKVFGNGSRDSIPAMLTPGEFVIRKAMVDKYGVPMMKALNQGSFAMPKYEFGEGAGEGFVAVNNNMVSNINAPVYNSYDMKFSINGANQSADEIANTVMFKMRQLQNQGIRTNRGY